MPNKDRSFHKKSGNPSGEEWLYSEQEQRTLCRFKPDTANVHEQLVAIKIYRQVLPRPPELMTRRRMLRHSAIGACEKMLKTG